VRGVDIWIAGGGDDLLANPDDTLIPGNAAVGPYPKPVADREGRNVLVVSTAGEYKYVGRLTVDFSRWGRVVRVDDSRSGPVRVSGTLTDPDYAPEDPVMKALVVDPVAAFSAGLASQPVGTTEVSLVRTLAGSPTNDPIRRRESGYGNLVADSYLWKARELAAADPQIDEPQVAIANGGGIRADIPAGPINRALTFAALPFFNQIVVVEDVGCEQLRQLLERGYAALPIIAGQFANTAGMRIEVDPTQPAQVVTTAPPVTIVTPGQRVRNLWLTNGTPQNTADDTQLVSNGAVVAGCAPVDLATVDFTARDGDAYPFTAQGLTFTSVGALYNQALEDYIMAPTSAGGLGGVVTAAQYSMVPSGVRRITIAGG
jgi:5'-nucleotidase / UDP-sugar diphosphatase